MRKNFTSFDDAVAYARHRGVDRVEVTVNHKAAIVGKDGVLERALRRVPDRECKDCGKMTRIYCKDRCRACYARMKRREKGVPAREDWGKHTHCRECGADEVAAHGLCKKCYNRMLEQKNRDVRKIQKRRATQKRNFGGRRADLVSKANGRCELCGCTEEEQVKHHGRRLSIHHVDGNGRTSENPNHVDDNLMVLCDPCHRKVHKNPDFARETGALTC